MRSADASRFAMIPRSDIPRSVFEAEPTHKTTFDTGLLIPIYLDEVLPGDQQRLRMDAFVRLATPLFPVMDNLYLDTFFFFVPNRLIWSNWKRFMGEQDNPLASTTYLIPQTTSPANGFAVNSLQDYMGLPTVGQLSAGATYTVSVLPMRAYNLIWNEWFRDQNMQTPVAVNLGDGPDSHTDYVLKRRGKRHDYFTSCLPWPQKPTSLDATQGFAFQGGAPVSGLGGISLANGVGSVGVQEVGGTVATYSAGKNIWDPAAANQVVMKVDSDGYPDVRVTINAMRQAFAVQKLLERDARGGTRYTELVRAHFGVISPDQRLQRPEYLGGGSTPITINPVVQTSATKAAGETAGGATPLGQLGAIGTGFARGHGFSQSFTEHGYILGLACVRADLTYMQGIHRSWRRRTKYDFYWPAFANLGEQPVLREELYAVGLPASDSTVFGYQERWAEYRHKPNRISGYFRSTAATTLDAWHFAQRFNTPPVLDDSFITEFPQVQRALAVGAAAAGKEVLFDSICEVRSVRPVPAFSVPGLGDRF